MYMNKKRFLSVTAAVLVASIILTFSMRTNGAPTTNPSTYIKKLELPPKLVAKVKAELGANYFDKAEFSAVCVISGFVGVTPILPGDLKLLKSKQEGYFAACTGYPTIEVQKDVLYRAINTITIASPKGVIRFDLEISATPKLDDADAASGRMNFDMSII